jgi:hypothetical protein
MRKRASFIVTAAVALTVVFVVGNRLTSVQGQGAPTRVAAVPGEKGGQDMFGAYNVQVGWPKPLSSVPGVGQWTWGAGQGVFAETPNRVFVLQRGMLPEIGRPKPQKIAPSVEFPIGRLPWRDATSASPPGALFKPGTEKTTQEPGDDLDAGQPDVDYKWARIINVIDAQGNHVEDWTQYDKMFRRPHSVFQSPYDPQKDVWIVDDYRHAIFRFSNDGKRLLQTIGTVNVPGTDATHFYRPTFMAWAPNGDFFVADGYQNTRVVKFDKDGKYLTAWGERGEKQGDAARLLQQRARHCRRSADQQGVRQRPRQPPHPGVRRQRQAARLLERGRGARRHPSDLHGWIAHAVGLRSPLVEDDQVRPQRRPSVHVRHVGADPGRLLGRPWHPRRLRRQPLCR